MAMHRVMMAVIAAGTAAVALWFWWSARLYAVLDVRMHGWSDRERLWVRGAGAVAALAGLYPVIIASVAGGGNVGGGAGEAIGGLLGVPIGLTVGLLVVFNIGMFMVTSVGLLVGACSVGALRRTRSQQCRSIGPRV